MDRPRLASWCGGAGWWAGWRAGWWAGWWAGWRAHVVVRGAPLLAELLLLADDAHLVEAAVLGQGEQEEDGLVLRGAHLP